MKTFTDEKMELLHRQKALTNHLEFIKSEAEDKKPEKELVIKMLKEHAEIYEKITGKKYDTSIETELNTLGY